MNEKEQLILDSQDLAFLCEYFGIPADNEITGTLVVVNDGDYESVKFTSASAPFATYAQYHDVIWWCNFYNVPYRDDPGQ
jgi:hypothetical protein